MIFEHPETLFRAAVAAFDAEDWARVAEMCDPASLSLFRSQELRSYHDPRPRTPASAEEYLRHVPDMPREVAKYHVAQLNADLDPVRQLKRDYPAVSTIDELCQTTPAEFFAAWLDGRSLRRQVQRLLEERSLPASAANEALRTSRMHDSMVVLGVVPDGERVAHVIYRQDAPAETDQTVTDPDEHEFRRDMASRSSVNALTCRRGVDGGWRLIADHSLFGHGANVVAWASDDAV